MDAGGSRRRRPLRTAALISGAAAAVIAAAAVVLFVWLNAYAPLNATRSSDFAPGPGLGANVQPTLGSGGKPVFIPAYRKGRPFDTAFTLENTGRFAVTLLGLAAPPQDAGALTAQAVLASDGATASADPANLHALGSLRLEPHDTAIVDVHWRLDCTKSSGQIAADRVRLRFRYLSLFTRTESVELPFAVTLRCVGGPPANP
jgi:hypothetical protein